MVNIASQLYHLKQRMLLCINSSMKFRVFDYELLFQLLQDQMLSKWRIVIVLVSLSAE